MARPLNILARLIARTGDYGKVMVLLLPLWLSLVGATWALLRVVSRMVPLRVIVIESVTLFAAMFLLVPLALWAARVHPLEAGRWWRSLGVHAGLLVIFGALDYLVERSLFLLIQPDFGAVRSRLTFLSEGPEGLVATLCLAGPFYVMAVAARHAFAFHQDLQERALRGAQLEAQYSESRLQALKSQLQPHFLFNALNAIYSHIPPEGEMAQRMVVLLSTFLRRSLQEMGLQRVSLRHELETVNLFLEIQQLRFGDRLRYHCEADEGALDLYVPHLVLQPLVENALKHGLGPKLEPGTVWVEARCGEAALTLTVKDDGVGAGRSAAHGTGTGLLNLRKRLQYLYGDRATFNVGPRDEGGFEARILIPLTKGRP